MFSFHIGLVKSICCSLCTHIVGIGHSTMLGGTEPGSNLDIKLGNNTISLELLENFLVIHVKWEVGETNIDLIICGFFFLLLKMIWGRLDT